MRGHLCAGVAHNVTLEHEVRGFTSKEHIPADQIGVSVQNPEKAQDLKQRGVRVRQGNFEDAASLAHAFEGASQVLIVSAPRIGELAVRLNRTAIDTAKAAGTGRILYTSHMGANPTSPFPPMRTHADIDVALQESGVAFTALRNGYYTSSGVMFLGNAVETGELAAPEDGPIAWTDHADLAGAAAITLAKGGLDGITPALTGSETLDLAGIAAIASEVTGRPIRRVVVSDDEFRSRLVAHGTPELAIDMQLGFYVASRQGEFAHIDPTLARLIGRSPMTVRDVLKATL